MGLPTTWILLSIFHLYWWRSARSEVLPFRSRLRNAAVICGDDLFAIAPPAVLDEYERRVALTGGELSEGKHMRTKSRAVYLEMLMEMDAPSKLPMTTSKPIWKEVGGKKVLHNWERDDFLHRVTIRKNMSVPLKGFFESQPESIGRRPDASLPDWIMAGEVNEGLRTDGHPPSLIFKLTRAAFPLAARQLRSRKIPPFLPRFCGGGGLVPKTGDETPVSRLASRGYRKALASLLTDESPDRDPSVLSRIWLSTKKRYSPWDLDDAEGLLSRVDHFRGDSPPEDGRRWFDCGLDFEEYCLSVTSVRMQKIMEPFSLKVSISGVQSALAKRIKILSSKWQSAHPWSKSVSSTRESYSLARERARVWLPPTEDPERPGDYGTPFWTDPQATVQLRRLVFNAMALPL